MNNMRLEHINFLMACVVESNVQTISENVKAALIAASATIILGIVSNTITIVTTYNNTREKKLLSYGKFYIEYIALLVQLILHCNMLKSNMTQNAFRKYLKENLVKYAYNNNVVFSSPDEKSEIEQIYSILLNIHALFKNGSYYPLSRKVHKNVVKLEKTIETLIWIHDNKMEKSQICNLQKNIQIPNLQKHIESIK